MKKYPLDKLIFFTLLAFSFSVIYSVTAVETAIFLVLALLLVKKHTENDLLSLKPSLTAHPLFLPWMFYLGVCLLTTLTAYYPAKGFGQLNSDFLKYVCLSTLLLSVKKEHLPKLSAVYTAAASIAAFAGILEVIISIYFGNAVITRPNLVMNPVRYGEIMGIALTLILSRIMLPVKETFKHEQLFYKLAVFPVFIALVLSQTRGAYLGAITAICFIFYFAKLSRKRILTYAAMLAGIVCIVLLANPAMRQRLTAIPATIRSGTTDEAINIRLELWRLGLTMFKAHPMLGVGPDNIKKVFKQFHPGPIGYQETWGSLHNLYIHQAAERGIIGLAALLTLFLSFFIFALHNYKSAQNPYTLWAVCALPAYYVMNLTEISFQHVHTSFAIFLALAAAVAAAKDTGKA